MSINAYCLNRKRQRGRIHAITFSDLSASCLSIKRDYHEYLKKGWNPQPIRGNGLSDESSPYNFESHHANGLLQLGYLVQNQRTHPFSITLQDLSNLFVVGRRAKDIYFNLLIQLCDEHRIPVIVIKGCPSEGLEEQVCECPFWHLNLEKDAITFNALNLAKGQHPSRQISILISLFEEFGPLSPTARNLFHVIIWKTIISTSKPTLEYLQNTLSFYQHHNVPYEEICGLLQAIPHQLLARNYDNITLSKLQHLPTIISTNDTPTITFAINMLILKLLANQSQNLPPLFLVDPPPLSPQLFHWLCTRYRASKSPLVIFQTQDKQVNPPLQQTGNFILTSTSDESPSTLHAQLTEQELHFLNLNNDQVAVRLRSEPATRFITIF